MLCLGVGCWGMKAGLPAVLRIVIGPPLSVAGSSFLGLEAEVNGRDKPEVPFGAGGGGGAPFACKGSADFLSGFEMTCRWASQRNSRWPSILAGHPGKEQLMIGEVIESLR